jgi:hypothetical protein
MKNNEITDGLTNEQWKEAQRCYNARPAPIRFADTVNSKQSVINFYLNPLIPETMPTYQSMNKERMISICYQLYHSKETDILKESAARLIKLIID